MTVIIPENCLQALEMATAVIQDGGLIAFPTDTVYGLACDVFNAAAIEKIYQIKGRDLSKAIPIMVGEIDHVFQVAEKVDERSKILIDNFWPGALTVILPKRYELPKGVSQSSTIGIRMPDHTFCLDLLRKTGPLAVTSANLSGNPDALSAKDVIRQLNEKIQIVIDGGKSAGGIPSTIVDCSIRPARIIREGAIKSAEILALIG